MSETMGTKRRMSKRWIGGVAVAWLGLATVVRFATGPARVEPKPVEAPVAMVAPTPPAPRPAPVVTTPAVDHLAEAERLRDDGRADDAEVAFDAARTAGTVDAAQLRRIARGSQGLAGERALEDLAELEPGDPEPLRELARRRLDAGDPDGALVAADGALERDPRGWEAHQLKGRALMAKGRLSAAIRSFRTATRHDDAPSHAYNNLGYAQLLAGRPTEALEALDAAIARGPVTHYMLNNLGLAYEKLGRLEDAEVAFIGALELKSDYVKAAVNLKRVAEIYETIAAEESRAEPELVPGG